MFFVWTTTWGIILTCDNLMKKGITLVDRYCMCSRNDETGSFCLLGDWGSMGYMGKCC